jgi:hypothetical protein
VAAQRAWRRPGHAQRLRDANTLAAPSPETRPFPLLPSPPPTHTHRLQHAPFAVAFTIMYPVDWPLKVTAKYPPRAMLGCARSWMTCTSVWPGGCGPVPGDGSGIGLGDGSGIGLADGSGAGLGDAPMP